MITIPLIVAALCAGLALPATAQDATRGKALFDANCSRCHRDGVDGFKTPPAEIAAFLAKKSVGAHRFQLSDAELQDIVACLTAMKLPQ